MAGRGAANICRRPLHVDRDYAHEQETSPIQQSTVRPMEFTVCWNTGADYTRFVAFSAWRLPSYCCGFAGVVVQLISAGASALLTAQAMVFAHSLST